ncbi:MAG: response regulator [Bacteroidales bacterium]|nr:response regulator [Bacteroidales bacterium]
MNLLSFFSFLVFFIYLIVGVYLVFSKLKSALHLSFLFLSLSLAVYALGFTFFYIAPDKEFAMFWYKFSSTGLALFPALGLNFALILTKTGSRFPAIIYKPLLFLPGLVFILQSVFSEGNAESYTEKSGFWKFIPDFSSLWLWLFLIYLTGCFLASVIVIRQWRTQISINKERIQSMYILWAMIIAYIFIFVSKYFLPWAGLHHIPEFAHFTVTIFIFITGYAIIKYRHVEISTEFASEWILCETREMVFFTDKNLIIKKCNPACMMKLGYDSLTLYNKAIHEISDLNNNPEFITKLQTSSENISFNTNFIIKNREILPAAMICKAVSDRWGDLTGYIFIAKDKRQELQLERETEENKDLRYELNKAREKADESDRLKSTFLSNVSHELRTPLNGILGFTEILKLELENSPLQELTEHIDRSGNRLMGTLNAIIDLSLIETNKNEIDKQPVNVADLVMHKSKLYAQYAESKNLYLEIDISENQIMSRTDERLLGQVINNLLDNAIKYTEKGGITISCGQISSGNRSWLLIKVKDTGIGIEPGDYGKIFERFRQSSEGQNRAYEGMGIGLSICKYFVELLDGEIWVESKPGKGSEFYVKMPAYFAETNKAEQSVHEEIPTFRKDKTDFTFQGKKPCVLIVEDDQSNREYMKYTLSEFFDVDISTSGVRALEMVQKNKYNLIFMDVNLDKDMSGVEAMKKIKTLENSADIVIAAVTANVLKNAREHLLKSGFTHYLAKPFSRENLLNLSKEMLDYKSHSDYQSR